MKDRDEHGSFRHAVGKMEDTIGGMAGKMSAKTVSDGDVFVEKLALGDLYELEAARWVLSSAASASIRAIAEKMLSDHTTSVHQLSAALQMNETRGLAAPPQTLDARRAKMIENLKGAPDDKREQLYLDQQVLAHEETFALLEQYQMHGDNTQLRSLAAGALPVVARHLTHLKALATAHA